MQSAPAAIAVSGNHNVARSRGKANAPSRTARGVRMTPKERAQLAAVQQWEQTGTAEALVSQGGEVAVAYGYSRPTISCAPLHVCTIKLIDGESITSIALGDTVRWLVQQSTAGRIPVVVVKPTQAGISTNLVITTDAGRIYYMHVVDRQKRIRAHRFVLRP